LLSFCTIIHPGNSLGSPRALAPCPTSVPVLSRHLAGFLRSRAPLFVVGAFEFPHEGWLLAVFPPLSLFFEHAVLLRSPTYPPKKTGCIAQNVGTPGQRCGISVLLDLPPMNPAPPFLYALPHRVFFCAELPGRPFPERVGTSISCGATSTFQALSLPPTPPLYPTAVLLAPKPSGGYHFPYPPPLLSPLPHPSP